MHPRHGGGAAAAALCVALTLQLTMRDVMQADTDPEALGRKLAGTATNKRWLHHPKAETFLAERVALLQRVYKR